MKPTERLVDLIVLFLNAKRPVPFEEIREAFPEDYEDPGEAAGRRKFERDKEELKELGIPLRYVPPDEDEDTGEGYVVDRDQMYLPELKLDPEEMALVYLAGLSLLDKSAFPWRDALAVALRKIELRTDASRTAGALPSVLIDHGGRDGGAELEERLSELERAVMGHKRIRFVYHAQYNDTVSKREVDPYGLFRRRGRWSLVGFSSERKAVRVFLVHRMRDLEVQGKPGTPDFTVPDEFRLSDYTSTPAWRYEVSAQLPVELDVKTEQAWMAEAEFGATGESASEGWRRWRVETTNPDAVVQWVLGMGPRARVVSPPELRERVRGQLARVLERLRG